MDTPHNCSNFSNNVDHPFVQLIDNGKSVYGQGRGGPAHIDHPGFSSGVHRWEIEMEEKFRAVVIGVSPLDLLDDFPGSRATLGCLNINYLGVICLNGLFSYAGFTFGDDEVIILELDMNARTVTWINESDEEDGEPQIITHKLPREEGAYLPCVKLSCGAVVSILSYQQLAE
eukprot:gnl/Dysnectes_brevis/4244_a5620_1009.p1 GENE.gnl/Dysnectes_brevis/4244_a5620_1009~~gnl/Dysnectes_brevis/4244_a5620_1009.p1  ORF type:complete len:173 (-),score=12.38 gnl/Dysnectes_brevis/4244_a5620_1009:52-570(-)